MHADDKKSLERRDFLRKAALTGAAAAWAAPVVQTVAATPAFAQTTTTPATCHHSLGGSTTEGCKGACTSSGAGCGQQCEDHCNGFCPVNPGAGNDRLCRCSHVCVPANWANCSYVGPAC